MARWIALLAAVMVLAMTMGVASAKERVGTTKTAAVISSITALKTDGPRGTTNTLSFRVEVDRVSTGSPVTAATVTAAITNPNGEVEVLSRSVDSYGMAYFTPTEPPQTGCYLIEITGYSSPVTYLAWASSVTEASSCAH